MMAMDNTSMHCLLNTLQNKITTQFTSPIATHIPTLTVVNIFKMFAAFKTKIKLEKQFFVKVWLVMMLIC